MTNSLVGMI
uniref:Uncharacterized protein n=1 Tax=Rhizophora mucronata TaxID=61149 RepID=A0A2P2PPK2_RHIMU